MCSAATGLPFAATTPVGWAAASCASWAPSGPAARRRSAAICGGLHGLRPPAHRLQLLPVPYFHLVFTLPPAVARLPEQGGGLRHPVQGRR